MPLSRKPHDIEAACVQLIDLGVRRSQFIKARIRVLNAAGALVRRALGWHSDLPEAEQAKIVKAAIRIMKVDSPSELEGNLAVIAERLRDEIMVSKLMAKPGEQHQLNIERKMREIARTLPVWPWAESVKGLSDLGLAIIVSQAGNLDQYPTYNHLKKRLGLAPITKNGITRAASTWRKRGGLTSDEWQDEGQSGPKYSPRRRAQMFAQVGTQIIGSMGVGPRPYVGEDVSLRDDLSYYQREFIRQLRREVEKDPTMGRPPKDGKESFSLHARMKAQRVVEQRLVKHLHRAWRRATIPVPVKAIGNLPAAKTNTAAKSATGREAAHPLSARTGEEMPSAETIALINATVAKAMADRR